MPRNGFGCPGFTPTFYYTVIGVVDSLCMMLGTYVFNSYMKEWTCAIAPALSTYSTLPTTHCLLPTTTSSPAWPCVPLVKYSSSSSSSCPPPRLPFGSYVQALNVSLVLLLIMNLLDVVMFERLNLHVGVPDWIFMLGKVRHAM